MNCGYNLKTDLGCNQPLFGVRAWYLGYAQCIWGMRRAFGVCAGYLGFDAPPSFVVLRGYPSVVFSVLGLK